MSWTKLGNLEWSHRDPQEFFDSIVKTNEILNRFTLYDGIKSKKEIPIFEATLTYDDTECTYDPQSAADISEKEFTVSYKRWGFQNCKNALEDTYRSVMLRKGQLNAETLDAQFKEWLFDYFVKLNAANVLNWSWNGDGANIDGIQAELAAEIVATTFSATNSTIVANGGDFTDSTEILSVLKEAYLAVSADNLAAIFGDADREFKPVILLSTKVYQAYQLAIAEYGVEYEGLEKGLMKTYLGMEVLHYAALGDDEIVITPISNLVLATDDYADADAIQEEYDAKTNSDNVWGQFKIGFSYKKSEDIVYYIPAAA